MIVGQIIVQRPRLDKLRHVQSLRFGHQKHQGVSSATLIVQRLHALSVDRDVLEMCLHPCLQRGGGAVRVQRQGKTVKEFATIAVRPQSQPMTSWLSSRIRVDNIAHGTVSLGVFGQSVARHRASKMRCQGRMMKRQLIQLTCRQNHFFHDLLVSNYFLAGTVVHVVEHGFVAIHFQQIFKFRVHDDGHVDTGIVPKMQHQLQLSAQFGVQRGTVKKSVGRVIKCKQHARFALAPFFIGHHVPFTLAQTTGSFQELVIASHVQLTAIVGQFQGLVGIFFAFHQLFDTLQIEFLKRKRVVVRGSVKGSRGHHSHDDQVGRPILERVVDFFHTFGGWQIVGPHFTSHGGVTQSHCSWTRPNLGRDLRSA